MATNLILRHAPLTALAAATVLALTACGAQSAGEAGVELIDGDLTELLDLGDLDGATCDEPDAEETGEEFDCTATAPSGEVVEFAGVMTAEDAIVMNASNVLIADDFDLLESDAPGVIAANFEVDPSTVSVVCPDETVFLNDDDQVFCEVTDASDGVTYQLIVNMEPFVPGDGFSGALYELGEPIG